MTDWLQASDDLHERVQAFILSFEASDDSFEDLALAIADYQASTIPAFARLIRSRGAHLDGVLDIPAVPVEAFRLARVAAHPANHDAMRFLTSGTTSGKRGQHCMRRTDTYRLSALTWGRRALVPENVDEVTVICLAPKADSPQSSSLGFMMQAFLESFDPEGAPDARQRWLLSESGVDLDGLRRVLENASDSLRPVLLLATSFALVHLIDELDGESIRFDGRLIVMQTGGFKGKSREIAPNELERGIARAFTTDDQHIVGEYGMTELSSQLYEGRLPGAGLCTPAGWYIPPPWLRVNAVDPIGYLEVPEGEVGLACLLDLANVDSAVRILTEDRIVQRGNAIRLLGRSATSPSRGCSLGDEELLTSQ